MNKRKTEPIYLFAMNRVCLCPGHCSLWQSLAVPFLLCAPTYGIIRPAIKTSVAKAPVSQIAVPTVIFIMHLSCLICKL